MGLTGSPRIVPFTGFANKSHAYISGLVVEANGLSKPSKDHSKWENAKELEFVRVRVSFCGSGRVVTTDKYGIFRCHFNDVTLPEDGGIWKMCLCLLRNPDITM